MRTQAGDGSSTRVSRACYRLRSQRPSFASLQTALVCRAADYARLGHTQGRHQCPYLASCVLSGLPVCLHPFLFSVWVHQTSTATACHASHSLKTAQADLELLQMLLRQDHRTGATFLSPWEALMAPLPPDLTHEIACMYEWMHACAETLVYSTACVCRSIWHARVYRCVQVNMVCMYTHR